METIILYALLYTCQGNLDCESTVLDCHEASPWVMMNQYETTMRFDYCVKKGAKHK